MARGIRENTRATALLTLLKATREKVVIFTRYLETLHYLARRLESAGISATHYHGGLSAGQKDACIAEFERSRQVLLCTEAAGEGRNLQFCNTMVNYDLPWNPMRIEQRVGRIHRIGQEREVYIYNLSAENTVEDYILWLLDSKINMFELVIGEMDMILGHLSDERDFEELITDIWLRAATSDEVARGFDELGEAMLRARAAYRQAQEYDEILFGEDFTAA